METSLLKCTMQQLKTQELKGISYRSLAYCWSENVQRYCVSKDVLKYLNIFHMNS
jgi:hypothetical protein